MAKELYIREPDSETARGPFNLEQIQSLAEAGQVDRETLYFDEELDDWTMIGNNDEIVKEVFPEKKKLSLKPKAQTQMDSLNAGEDEIPEVSVDEMLAAAEGDTEETKHIKESIVRQNKAASMSLPILGLMMLISALTQVYPSIDVIQEVIDEENWMLLLQKPLLLVGMLDLLIAVCLLLAVSEIFPLLRFRAVVGLGYFGFIHWAAWYAGDANSLYLMIGAITGSVGIYVCSLTLNLYLMYLCAFLGIAGMALYAWFNTFSQLLA